MHPKRNVPRFCDPDEFVQDPGKQNHFPTVYGAQNSWIILMVIIAIIAIVMTVPKGPQPSR